MDNLTRSKQDLQNCKLEYL